MSSDPDIFGCPICFSCRLIYFCTECTFIFFPRRIVEIIIFPVCCRLGSRIASIPFALLRCWYKGIQLYIFSTHKTIGNAIHLYGSYKRKVFSCPVLYSSIVQIICHRPRTGVWVYCDQRVRRGS